MGSKVVNIWILLDRWVPGLDKVMDRWVIRYWTGGFQGTGQMGSEVLDIGVPRYWTDGFR